MKDVSAFFKEKAKIDEAYASQLKKLVRLCDFGVFFFVFASRRSAQPTQCASKPGASMFTKDPPITKETKTLKDSVMAVLEQTTALSNAHLAMAQKGATARVRRDRS